MHGFGEVSWGTCGLMAAVRAVVISRQKFPSPFTREICENTTRRPFFQFLEGFTSLTPYMCETQRTEEEGCCHSSLETRSEAGRSCRSAAAACMPTHALLYWLGQHTSNTSMHCLVGVAKCVAVHAVSLESASTPSSVERTTHWRLRQAQGSVTQEQQSKRSQLSPK